MTGARVFIDRMAASPRAEALLLDAAYRGDLTVVDGLVSRGVPVVAIDRRDWRTALHAAAVWGHLPMLRYLVAKGVDVNAVDRHGDSPLELAASRGHAEAARFLTEHGAVRIRGDDARGAQVIYAQVREDSERTRSRPGG